MDFHLSALSAAVNWLLQEATNRKVIAFFAPMGAGKTTISGALLHAMGVSAHTGSPTFSIVNEYVLPNGQLVYHMDWYRLKDESEAIDAGIEDTLYSGHHCLIEWPERAPALLPPDALKVGIDITGPETRRLYIIK